MVIPCIDLQGGKVVQLVHGREKALEGAPPLEMLKRFAAFPEIQVIDLDAATGEGRNDAIVEMLASRAAVRVGGGVRTAERARALVDAGARKVIVGTAAFDPGRLAEISAAVGKERLIVALDSSGGRVVIKGWRESTEFRAEETMERFEPYCSGFLCTYVDKEGMMQGTNLEWFRQLRRRRSSKLRRRAASRRSKRFANCGGWESTRWWGWRSTREGWIWRSWRRYRGRPMWPAKARKRGSGRRGSKMGIANSVRRIVRSWYAFSSHSKAERPSPSPV